MSNTDFETRTTQFNCPSAGGHVEIRQNIRVRRDRRGEEQARFVAGTECSKREACPAVAIHKGHASSYDWSKCQWLQSH